MLRPALPTKNTKPRAQKSRMLLMYISRIYFSRYLVFTCFSICIHFIVIRAGLMPGIYSVISDYFESNHIRYFKFTLHKLHHYN